ncbi:MAG: adenylate/guanylate cyclase domain-containing protein [Candidatus Rokubacteria bacterium]|nr:adenylate/guanylate cyclase domain-containing protein [Candidatus Rokubacteria bacterium]
MRAALARHWRSRGAHGSRVASFLIALVIAVLMLAAWYSSPTLLIGADQALYDQHLRIRGPRPGHEAVAIVAIDEPSLRAIGRWPWPRSVLADLITKLTEAGVAAIGVDIILNEPEQSGELRAARILRERLGARADAATVREIDALMRASDRDALLADAIRASDRVVLPSVFDLAPPPPAAPERQGQPYKSAITSFFHYDDRGFFPPPSSRAAGVPIPPLLEAAKSLGHVNMMADFDGVTRWEALVVEYRGYYYPSLALETVRVAAGLEPSALKIDFGRSVQLQDYEIAVDWQARALINYAGGTHSFAHHSAAAVLAGRVPADQLRDRIVFIGATAEGVYDLRVTPFSSTLPGVEKHANVAANLIERRFVHRTVWAEIFEAGSTFLLPLWLGLLLPRLRPLPSLGAALLIQAALAVGVHVAFRQGAWVPIAFPSVAIGLTFVVVTVYRFLTEERQRMWTKRAFAQYVSPEVVERIIADPGALQFGGELRDLSVLFADIRGFTTYTESHDPHDVVARLREHLTAMTNIIIEERGTLDKYIGDAVMAVFGAPIPLPDHAVRACRAALRMIEETERQAKRWEEAGTEPFFIGVGVNSGPMVVGNLGSEQLFSYTVVGDEVNLGARLEALTREKKPARWILISESTYEAARDAIDARPLGEVMVKGKTRAVTIYELLAMKPAPASSAVTP